MLSDIIRLCLRFRGVVIALACLVAGYGVFALSQARQDVFPEFAPPLAVIQTEAPGLTSEQVETLVTQPVEDAVGGILRLADLRSRSFQGLSMVTLTFKDGTDIFKARQLVIERLNAVYGTLPQGVHPPMLLPLTSSTAVTLVAGLTSDRQSLMDLRTLADKTVKPQLLRVPGVADVIVFGGDVKQAQIQVDPRKLVEDGLALQDILGAAKQATGIVGAGYIETTNQRIVVSAEGQALTPEELSQVVLRYKDGVALRLGDVAHVKIGAAPAVGAASIGGKPAVSLMVESQYGADMKAVSFALERKLKSLQPVLAARQVKLYPAVFRPAAFVETAIGHLRTALILGGALVSLVLVLFLFDMRAAVISLVAIPLSLLTAVIVLNQLGISLNTMTLGGLAIALGEVVDDAVIDVENIVRRLRLNQKSDKPLTAFEVVLRASIEVRSAVVFATLIVALVFLPVMTLSGMAGRLFAPLGLSYILAILGSLLVALTVTPALALILLAKRPLNGEETALVRVLKARYLCLLTRIEPHSRLIAGMVGILCVASIAMVPFFNGDFIPQLQEGHYLVHMALAPGSSLSESMRIGDRVSMALGKVPGVRLVAQRAGRASEVVDPAGVNISEFEVDLKPLSPSEERRTVVNIEQALARFPGLITSVNTFLVERIDESISGVTAPVVINVFGKDLDEIDQKAREIANVVSKVRGAIGLRLEAVQYKPQLTLRLRPEQLTRWGFTPVDVLQAIQIAYAGVDTGEVYAGNQAYSVNVSLSPTARKSVADIGSLMLKSPFGVTVPLHELAYIGFSASRYQILHSGGQRVQTVTCGVHGRTVSDFVREVRQRIARTVKMPEGTYVVFGGEDQARTQAQTDLLFYAGAALLGVFLLLFLALRRIRSLLLVMANLPFALAGGVLTVFLGGGDLSLGASVGFVTLFGITLRNSIMLISHYEHIVSEEGAVWGPETARQGACERLVPILMTATVTALGLLPLAMTSGAAGNEIEGPMAIVILGGLVTSTVLNLLVLPVLALRFGRFGELGEGQ